MHLVRVTWQFIEQLLVRQLEALPMGLRSGLRRGDEAERISANQGAMA